MNTYAFDTLEQAQKLERIGFSESEARALMEFMAATSTNLVTKNEFHQEVSILRHEMQLRFVKFERKILGMSITVGTFMIAALGAYSYLFQFMS